MESLPAVRRATEVVSYNCCVADRAGSTYRRRVGRAGQTPVTVTAMDMTQRPPLVDAARAWLENSPAAGGTRDLVRQAIEDYLANRYFGAAPRLNLIHAHRRSMYDDDRSVQEATGVEDDVDDLTVDFTARNATHPEKGRLLFHLARVFAPGSALELGTSIGISAAYLRTGLSVGGGGEMVTIDHSLSRTTLASRNWTALDIAGITQVVGRFDDVLPGVLDTVVDLRLAYIDGNHRRHPTMKYFEMVRSRMTQGVVLFDDIRWSDEMVEAWEGIAGQDHETVDLGWVGMALIEG